MEDINAQDACGWSRLHKAADRDDWRSVKSLLEEKANPHIYTVVGNSPLMLSVSSRRSNKCFHLLLKYETRDTFMCTGAGGRTVLDIAIYRGAYDYVSSIIDVGGEHSLSVNTSPPLWFTELLEQRKNIKRTLIVFHHLGRKNPYLKKDMTDKIVRMIWETRDSPNWLIHEESSPKKMKI